MAISSVAAAKAQATETAPVSAPVATQTRNKGDKTTQHDLFKSKGAKIRQQYTEEEKALEGSASKDVAFIGCLGDPARPSTRREGKGSVPTLSVVGYQLKALADIEVPVAKLKQGFKSLMDVEEATTKIVKAGEIFNLSVYEAGVLISQPKFAGRFTGEGTNVYITCKFSQNREEPLPVLKSETGSIKTNMIPVAEMRPNPADPSGKGTAVVKPEFADKFDVLYMTKSAGKKSTSEKAASGEVQADIAAAFNALFNSKNA